MTRMTDWPIGDQYVAVSTVVRPVTNTADTLVKAVVNKDGRSMPEVETGSMSNPVPTATAVRYAKDTIRAGCSSLTLVDLRTWR